MKKMSRSSKSLFSNCYYYHRIKESKTTKEMNNRLGKALNIQKEKI